MRPKSTLTDAKIRYITEQYRLKDPLAAVHIGIKTPRAPDASTAADRRREAFNFGGLGVLCVLGTAAAIHTGPFPLNFAVGAGIALPFVVEAAKRMRRRRAARLARA